MILGWNFLKAFLITVNVIKGKSSNPVSTTNVLGKLRGTLLLNIRSVHDLAGLL